MQDVIGVFKEVEAKLKAKPWFKKDKWMVSYHPFPSKKPDAVTLHIFKKHWFNEDTRGIHIESFLYLDLKKRKKSSVCIHLLHEDEIPGTKLKRIAVTKPFVDAIYDEVKTWPGYKFRAGKYGLQPFSKELNGLSPKFGDELAIEIEKLCKKLGPEVDQALKELKTTSH